MEVLLLFVAAASVVLAEPGLLQTTAPPSTAGF